MVKRLTNCQNEQIVSFIDCKLILNEYFVNFRIETNCKLLKSSQLASCRSYQRKPQLLSRKTRLQKQFEGCGW